MLTLKVNTFQKMFPTSWSASMVKLGDRRKKEEKKKIKGKKGKVSKVSLLSCTTKMKEFLMGCAEKMFLRSLHRSHSLIILILPKHLSYLFLTKESQVSINSRDTPSSHFPSTVGDGKTLAVSRSVPLPLAHYCRHQYCSACSLRQESHCGRGWSRKRMLCAPELL